MKRRLQALELTMALLYSVIPTGAAAATGNTGAKLIAFTFDDGPSRYTSQLLDGLKERGGVATFFMTGVNGSGGITNYTSLLTRMRDEGHQLANHTYSHITPFNTQSASTITWAAGSSGVQFLVLQLLQYRAYQPGRCILRYCIFTIQRKCQLTSALIYATQGLLWFFFTNYAYSKKKDWTAPKGLSSLSFSWTHFATGPVSWMA